MDERASSPCRRCAGALGRSCCEVEEGDALATLTWSDVARLESAGHRRARFLEEEWLSAEEVAAAVARRPLYDGYYDPMPRRLTLQRRAGACVFFESGRGCTLTASVRPTACLLYPFDVGAVGLGLQVDRFPTLAEAQAEARLPGGAACLAVQEASDWETLAAAFDTEPTAIVALAQRLEAEVHEHAKSEARSARVERP